MKYGIISLAILASSFLLATLALSWSGVTKPALIEASRSTASDSPFFEELSISDGGLAKVSCTTSNLIGDTVLKCTTKVDTDWLITLDVLESEDEAVWVQEVGLTLVPRLADKTRAEALAEAVLLSGSENETQTFLLVSVTDGIAGAYTSSRFEVGSEAIKALVASEIRTASEIYQRELTRVDVERLSEMNAEILDRYLGSLNVRENLVIMVLQGPMEYIILSLGIGSLLLLVWGFVVTYGFREARVGSTVISQSSALGGSLTYLGLLGTLLGMFGTVIELSGIDFVDELRKVFDQTGSFGSMALAIGTSVVGLAGSVVVWLSHILLSVLFGRRI